MKERKQQGSWNVSRRSFLKGGAVLGASTALGGLLAGCSPAETSVASDSPNLSEGQYSFEIAPDPVPEDKIVETVEADVVIVGAGLAGTFAAVAAAEEGASVVVLQKSSQPVTHGIGFCVFDAGVQRANGNVYDLKVWTQYFTEESYGYGNQPYIESIIYNSGRAIDMLMKYAEQKGESFGTVMATPNSTMCVFDCPEVTNGYSRVPNMVNKLVSVAEELGAEYRYSTPAVQLETEEGRVVAVIAKSGSEYIRAKASKGVILATGDIGNDPEMVAKYAPFCQGLPNTYMPQDNTGDGHKMALWIGARMFKGPFSQAIHYDPSPLPEGDAPFSGSPYLAVNALGIRYQNEDLDYPVIANLNCQQPGNLRWQIIDKTFTEYWSDFGTRMARDHGFEFTTNEEALETCLENGAILKAESLDELAANMGFEGKAKDTLFATIKRYNELCDAGVDEDFGKNPEYLVKTAVKEPPFYSIKRSAAPLALLDGVYATEKMEAYDTEMSVIPGLYVTGNVAHGMFNVDYTLDPGGISCGRALSSGYIAGKAVVNALPDYKSYYQDVAGESTAVNPGVQMVMEY
ncbi:FAD-binding protein [Eggerthella sp. YY7918]|uniref:FAD-dependent oxidoreductase n=1 Tax=Eggerthella sp. (strain YY7918) TaxID=502558 RepID=UPI0002F4929F|nr:FAD-binding protein [Eggerthella sp. YY7918]